MMWFVVSKGKRWQLKILSGGQQVKGTPNGLRLALKDQMRRFKWHPEDVKKLSRREIDENDPLNDFLCVCSDSAILSVP